MAKGRRVPPKPAEPVNFRNVPDMELLAVDPTPEELAALSVVPRVLVLQVEHDAWCGAQYTGGKGCRCNPILSVLTPKEAA
jgi:hypothetical protein